MSEVTLRTGVWYNDRAVTLSFPDVCDVTTFWPRTPAPLSDAEIVARLAAPKGQPPLRELARGCSRPVVIVDDLTRPTPVHRVMPMVLEEFAAAGIPAESVRILIATGTHGNQNEIALSNKLGKATMARCKVIVHDDTVHARLLGKTSFGTPVYPDAELTKSDLVIGIGGVYPQHTTGFGGGGKLALGVMERRTIRHLHFRHQGVEGTYNIDNDFRRDVGEVARMIGMRCKITLHIDWQQQVVSVMSGDHEAYYREAARISRTWYDAPAPDEADVVIANGYPSDVSYTFTRKGMKPVRCAPPGSTRIVVASNHEGLGTHGLFQQGLSARIEAYRDLYNRIRVMDRREIAQKIGKRIRGVFASQKVVTPQPVKPAEDTPPRAPMILFQPPGSEAVLPELPGVNVMTDWNSVVERMLREQANRKPIRVFVYPCAPLQCLDAVEPGDGGAD